MKRLTALLICLPASAATYYVDPATGNNANAGTSTGTAWAELPGTVGGTGAGWVQLVNGDTVLVKGGSANNCQMKFTPTWYAGSDAYGSIIVRSGDLHSTPWGTGRAIIDGQSTRTYGVWLTGSLADGTLKGITLDGFEVRNIASGGVGIGFDPVNGSCCIAVGGTYATSHLTIRRCYLHDALRDADDRGHGIEFSSSSNWIVTQCIIGTAIGTKGCEPYGTISGVFSNNFVSGTGDHGLALNNSTNIDVCNNLFLGSGAPVHNPTYAIAASSSQNCDVWNNVITHKSEAFIGPNDWNAGIGVYASSPKLTVGLRFVQNTIALLSCQANGGVSTAFRLGDDSGSWVSNILVANNLVISCTNSVGLEQFYLREPGATNCTVVWNDFYGTAAGQTVMARYDGLNPFYTTVAGFTPTDGGTWANNVQLSPEFVGGPLPSGLDAQYHPNSSCFALGGLASFSVRGTPNVLPAKFSTDILGNPRRRWSMGAYEVPSMLFGGSIHGKTLRKP